METNPFAPPWIKNPKFVNIVWFYSFLFVLPMKKLIELFWEYCKIYKKKLLFSVADSVGMVLFSLLGKLGCKLNFYNCPLEVKFFKKFRSVLSV